MKIMIDTNILIDVFAKREKFYEKSLVVYLLAVEKGHTLMIPASLLTDIYYIMARMSHKEVAFECIRESLETLIVVDTKRINIEDALRSKGSDFEDNVLASIARRNSADYIITRNTKDFAYSKVKAVTPEEFLKKEKKDNLRVHEKTLDIYTV